MSENLRQKEKFEAQSPLRKAREKQKNMQQIDKAIIGSFIESKIFFQF